MEKHIGMFFQPSLVAFMDAVIVNNHMVFTVGWELCQQVIHESQKPFFRLFARGSYFAMNISAGHTECGEKIYSSIALISALNALD